MKKFATRFPRLFFVLIFILSVTTSKGQNVQLQLKDFAVWGGNSSPTSYSGTQGVLIGNKVTIQGNIGSNHQVDAKNNFTLTGNIYSGNLVSVGNSAAVTGHISAAKKDPAYHGVLVSGGNSSRFAGNLTANGKVNLKTGGGVNATAVTGQVAVPAPVAANYIGPLPLGNVVSVLSFPALPQIPNNTPFDNQSSIADITNTQILSPGSIYRKLALTGNKTITFNGPGNYIFYEVTNSNENKFIFDFKNTSTGTINIFIIKDAKWGKLAVRTINGNHPSRIYTEIHGTGAANNGFAFDVQGVSTPAANEYIWLGNVWSPNGGINIKTQKPAGVIPHVKGALWSGKKINLEDNVSLAYEVPGNIPAYIDPYYQPPATGKVDAANNIIGAELTALTQDPSPITTIVKNEIFRIKDDKVVIEIISNTPNDNTLKADLIAAGLTDTVNNGPHTFIITGSFPINQLQQLNTNPRIKYVRPLYPPITNGGQVTTQGDVTMRSHNVRGRFGVDGSGVKVGVISDSYNSKLEAQNDVDQGDLPGMKTSGQPNENPEPVQVLEDLLFPGNDEGRAMLQIVHDVAPKSKLAFRTGFLTAGDFARGIQQLADPNQPGGRCDIIVDDITYITEPFLRDGKVAEVVDEVVAQGVTYFSSAGNFGKKSYESSFVGVTNTAVIPAPGQLHQFGNTPDQIYQNIKLKPGSYTIVLQWSDEFYSLGNNLGVETDMDLYLVGMNGFTLFGFNRSNLSGDPFEVCPFNVREETDAKVMIVKAAGNTNVRFKYIIFRGDGTIVDFQNGESSIVGHPNAKGCIAVGAMLYENIPQFTPIWPGVASFSSRGGTSTFKNNIYETRNKPELIGPNGANTTVNLGGAVLNDGDAYPNFFGTSAAAPHVAAVGALLIQGRKKFNTQTIVTPDQIRQQLQSSAGKFSYIPDNFSFEGGYGFVQADSAMQQIANARPIIDSLFAVTPGAQNGNHPFMVGVKGKYLTSNTKIYFRGKPIANTIVSADKTLATGMIPDITSGEDPAFQLYNPAKSNSGLDGGLSEALHFFSSRANVTVIAVNKSRKYGQQNPPFTPEVLINGIPIEQTNIPLASLKLDGNNISYSCIATPTSDIGLYGIFPIRTTPLDNIDSLNIKYSFTFVSGTLSIEKMPLKITPNNKKLKYGEYLGEITYQYELELTPSTPPSLIEEVKALHKKTLADNALAVLNGFNSQNVSDLNNMSAMTSFQAVRNARKFLLENGELLPLPNNISTSQLGDQRFLVDVSAQSLQNYLATPALANLHPGGANIHDRGLLNLKSLANGGATASLQNAAPVPMINGQLLAMVNGQLQAMVNGQIQALVNGVYVTAEDMVFQNGQLMALVNGEWEIIANGQLQALVNGQNVTIELSVQANGQLQALVNGQLMALVNGQLQALVNGQLLALVNGQLQALVNGQLMPLVNGQLLAMVNGQLQALVNGQLMALVNGQLMALVNGELQAVQDLSLANGQLQALVNGQIQALVNGQLKVMLNGTVTDVPTSNFNLVNGQLQAMVNGQLLAMVNGQLMALVNGQLQALVNGDAVEVESVRQLANGQLQALVNGTYIPISNGQLQALVNGQLLAMVNGQLMALVNGEITFAVFANGQLQALVNGQLQALVNGQLQAMVNGQLQEVNSYSIVNGQLQALVNGQTLVYPNGQLLALVNGQLQALVNNFDVNGTTNNTNTVVIVDQDDVSLQSGHLCGMFSINMITGLDAGMQTLIPGGFINRNFDVTYGMGQIEIMPKPLTVTADDVAKTYGSPNPALTMSFSGFAFNDNAANITQPDISCAATELSPVNIYPITLNGGSASNYSLILRDGKLTIGKKTLTVAADNKTRSTGIANPPLTINYNGLVGDDTKDSVCVPFIIPSSPKIIDQLERRFTHSNVLINGTSNVFYATPGQSLTLTGNWSSAYFSDIFPNYVQYCPGCITQMYIGMNNENGVAFTQCYDVTGTGQRSGSISRTFNAPTSPGVYYITQKESWEYACYDRGAGNPGNNAADAIAVVVVNVSSTNITAITTADISSPAGNYPITLQACSFYNPNYEVILQNGTLNVTDLPCNPIVHLWKGDGNFNDVTGGANGSPVGSVTATGIPQAGSNSFSLNGSGYISAGTAGSVSGTGYLSVSAWIKTTSAGPMVIINQRDANNNGEYILKVGGIHSYPASASGAIPGKAYFLVYSMGSNLVDLISSTSVNDGDWHFIRGEREGTTVRLYVDGVLEASGNTGIVVGLDGTINTYIGKDVRDNASVFNGLIDEVQVAICPEESSARMMSSPLTSIAEKTKPTADGLYPNPATSLLVLQLAASEVSTKDIEVFDMVGKRVSILFSKSSEGVYRTNVSALEKGAYIIKVQTGTGIKSFKFIKM